MYIKPKKATNQELETSIDFNNKYRDESIAGAGGFIVCVGIFAGVLSESGLVFMILFILGMFLMVLPAALMGDSEELRRKQIAKSLDLTQEQEELHWEVRRYAFEHYMENKFNCKSLSTRDASFKFVSATDYGVLEIKDSYHQSRDVRIISVLEGSFFTKEILEEIRPVVERIYGEDTYIEDNT